MLKFVKVYVIRVGNLGEVQLRAMNELPQLKFSERSDWMAHSFLPKTYYLFSPGRPKNQKDMNISRPRVTIFLFFILPFSLHKIFWISIIMHACMYSSTWGVFRASFLGLYIFRYCSFILLLKF